LYDSLGIIGEAISTLKLAERSEFLGLADSVVDSLNRLRAIRENLASAPGGIGFVVLPEGGP